MKLENNPINVLLIGNNPTELSTVSNFLKGVKPIKFISDTAFTISDSLNKLRDKHPECILVDDNLNEESIKELMHGLRKIKSLENVPVTLLKSSNYREIRVPGISDFLLKENLSREGLSRSIQNSLKFARTRRLAIYSYTKGKRKLKNFLSN